MQIYYRFALLENYYMKTTNGKRGGNLVGKPHNDKSGTPVGGIKAQVTDAGGKPVELEGGEVIINKEASKKYWKELSKINQSAGNGVPIERPIDPHDEDPSEYEEGGKIIEFNRNHLPNKWILSYAKNIKTNHPEIWKLGGNIYGNTAFENLSRVAERGYWLDSEEWMYKKWQSFLARHQHDFRIAGVVAVLKWGGKVNKGWKYMKDLIEDKISKSKPKSKSMKDGGSVKTDFHELDDKELSQALVTFWNDFQHKQGKYLNISKDDYTLDSERNLLVFFRKKEFTKIERFNFALWIQPYLSLDSKPFIAKYIKGYTIRGNRIFIKIESSVKFEDGGSVKNTNLPKVGSEVRARWNDTMQWSSGIFKGETKNGYEVYDLSIEQPKYIEFYGEISKDPYRGSKIFKSNKFKDRNYKNYHFSKQDDDYADGGSVGFEDKLFDELAQHDAPSFKVGGKVKKANKGGDCYEAAGNIVIDSRFLKNKFDFIGTPYLVHAEVTGQGAISGIKYGHAWVEDDAMVYDYSNNRQLVIPKVIYYAIGNIKTNNPKKYIKYTFEEARRKMSETGDYGHWDLDVQFKEGGEVEDNKFNPVIIYHEKNGNWFVPKNTTYAWLYDVEDASEKLNSQDFDYILFPPNPSISMAFQKGFVPSLLRIWTPKYQKETKGSKYLLGIVQGWYDEINKKFYVMMMTTNPKHRRKGINGYIIKEIREKFDLSKDDVIFDKPTDMGKSFMKSGKFEDGGEVSSSEFLNVLKKVGITEEERENWRESHKVNQKQVRNDKVKEAAEKLKDGIIPQSEYLKIVAKEQPIKLFTEVPALPNAKDIVSALDKNKVAKGVVNYTTKIEDGDYVASRLDIPAYEDYDTWVVSIHDGVSEKKVIAYGQTAYLKNVEFKTFPKTALFIATGNAKTPIGRMYGYWENKSPNDVRKMAVKYMNDPNWVQVGMNPFRHSWFYDKKDGMPLVSSSEVIQVGALVLAKNPVKTTPENDMFIADKNNPSIKFKEGGEVENEFANTMKLIDEIKKHSFYTKGTISTAKDGSKYRYDNYKLKYPNTANWLVQLFEKASEEITGKSYHTQFNHTDKYSFAYDRARFKGMPHGKMSFKELVLM